MQEPVLSTYKILKEKACNADIDESWIEWAMEMIQAGYETDSLYQLAGISKPFNQFELHDLANKVLTDLHLDYSDKRKTVTNYVYFLAKSNLSNTDNYFNVLKEFRDIYYELDMDSELQYFALLYWAKEDLLYDDYQHYWDGADRTNIDKIIKENFELFINKFDNSV
jgi:hypothetical protein